MVHQNHLVGQNFNGGPFFKPQSSKFVDHFLRHCTMVRDIWLLVFSLFEVSWVTLKTIIQLLSCGQWRFQRHLRFKDWNTVPLCVLWTIRLV